MRLVKTGNYAEACPKFEESQRQEPSLGTQYYLADRYERSGRTASAWANFAEVADKARMAKETAKARRARARADALEPNRSRLTVDVENRTCPGSRYTGTRLRSGPDNGESPYRSIRAAIA